MHPELETTLQAAVLTLLRANSLLLSNSALLMKKPLAGGQRSDTTHLIREGKSPRRDQRPTARAKSQRSAELLGPTMGMNGNRSELVRSETGKATLTPQRRAHEHPWLEPSTTAPGQPAPSAAPPAQSRC